MVEPIHVAIGLFLAGLALLELSGKTDFLGRRKRAELVERYEASREPPVDDSDDDPRF